jgi:hypothetical protein
MPRPNLALGILPPRPTTTLSGAIVRVGAAYSLDNIMRICSLVLSAPHLQPQDSSPQAVLRYVCDAKGVKELSTVHVSQNLHSITDTLLLRLVRISNALYNA